MTVDFRNSDSLPAPVGYSHASVGPSGGRVVHLAGQIGTDAGGNHAEGLAGQTEQALRNLAAALEGTTGATMAQLAKLNVYVVGWRSAMARELAAGIAAAGADHPMPVVPITLVGVQSLYLDETLVEIDGVAVID